MGFEHIELLNIFVIILSQVSHFW